MGEHSAVLKWMRILRRSGALHGATLLLARVLIVFGSVQIVSRGCCPSRNTGKLQLVYFTCQLNPAARHARDQPIPFPPLPHRPERSPGVAVALRI